ncbi:MAG: tRNA (adenosine(37)-N6)-dimethylallyltransferase MiaA [Patescibacteria group bacterium]
MKDKNNNKLLVILGPTSSGKTKLAVRLARKFNGEIVGADSRQVYRGMDIGTGKDLHEFRIKNSELRIQNIPYHLIDIVSPKTEFNLAKYQKLAYQAINDILRRGKLPILVGGTGLYLQAVVEGYDLGGVKPDKILRADLDKKTIGELQRILKKLDPNFKIKLENKRYLIRYIEMIKQKKLPLEKLLTASGSKYDCLILGMDFPRAEINQRIDKRLIDRIEHEGMITEIEKLHQAGVSWKRLESFGLEYKFVSRYLQKKLSKPEMIEKLAIAIHQFAKRQMTWFRRWERQGRKIKWIKKYEEANLLIKTWVK